MKQIIQQLTRPLRILVIDDDEGMLETIGVFLEDEDNIEPHLVNDATKLEETLATFLPHIVLTDLKMPSMTGMDVLRTVNNFNPEIEVVLMTAHASAQSAVEAMKEGAYDYLIKPFKMAELLSLLEKIVHAHVLERQNLYLQSRLEKYEYTVDLQGKSDFAARVGTFLKQVSDNTASILITGESGTGKSMLASTIHKKSKRSKKPFVTIECASIPGELLESELFGYTKGAFTGAAQDKPGRMELADGGTLFLDEIGDMPLKLQAKMLRVLQEKELVRVGGMNSIPIDVRIIAATNKDLQAMVGEGTFREDLFYRLNVIPFHMPPLRDRREDIPELVDGIIARLCRRQNRKKVHVSPELLDHAMSCDWPGNIRELENALERSMIFTDGEVLDKLFIQEKTAEPAILTADTIRKMELPRKAVSLPEIERIIVEKALETAGQDRKAAAKQLGIEEKHILEYQKD